ncbi:hypothetical protein ASG92_24515 [Arthrobacter sp. Soil736]|uniref:hypothetical protein n=1 Tax=Arthrobacter sp. Soil736 TaxID=1736395 RepID=UPI0006FF5ED7|nr:hypothetical protein [Arthrobacter sp. Soil736]KRE54781.1 hypothetical protein ASG92_24515 [Arthrobacter sp. Soil736]
MGHKRQSRKKIRSRLERSMDEQQPVSIARTVKKGTERHGVVQEIGDEWMLMAAVRDGGYLNGYMAVRLDLIHHVRTDRGLEDFLKDRPDWPPAILTPGSTASPHSILEAAIETSSVLSIFMEEKWPRPFFVGVPVKYSEKAVKLVTIDSKAKWEDGTFKVKYRDLTQISFGGDYEKALWATIGGLAA